MMIENKSTCIFMKQQFYLYQISINSINHLSIDSTGI